MARISNPSHVDNPELRELAIQAAWVAKLEDAVAVLEDLVFAVDNDDEETSRIRTLNRGKRIRLSLHSTWCVPTRKKPIVFLRNG